MGKNQADDLLSGTVKGTKKQTAMDFLENVLADGEMPQSGITKVALSKGIKERTLRTVKEELNIKAIRKNNQWYWSLN